MIDIYDANGLLFVGDPHVWSKGPGKRLDRDRFAQVSIDKLDQAVNIANERNLQLVLLGDLFHRDSENNIPLLVNLMRVLKKLKHTAITVVGNHEIKQKKLNEEVATTLLVEAQLLYCIETNDEIWGRIHLPNKDIAYLGGTPYSSPLPKKVKTKIKENKNGKNHVFWVTHHDLDFGESYPGVIPIPYIEGVNLLVNGHIHKLYNPVKINTMHAFNPGNILRLSIDTKEHEPSVWMWNTDCENYKLEQIKLNFERFVFDLTGTQINPTYQTPDLIISDQEELSSVFVEKMQSLSKKRDPSKTDDGAYIKESIQSLAQALQVDSIILQDIINIANESIEDIT